MIDVWLCAVDKSRWNISGGVKSENGGKWLCGGSARELLPYQMTKNNKSSKNKLLDDLT